MKINKINIIIFLIILITTSCNITPKKQKEKELEIGIPANDFAINKEVSKIIVEERLDRTFEDLPIDEEDIVEIEEKQFLTKINNIKNKIDEYKNKLIVVEGMFATYSSWDESFKGNLVYRNGPNDFNNDIWGGFFLNDTKGSQVKIDDWIRVVGKPYIYTTKDTEGETYEYLFLDVQDITILDENERGLELVNN